MHHDCLKTLATSSTTASLQTAPSPARAKSSNVIKTSWRADHQCLMLCLLTTWRKNCKKCCSFVSHCIVTVEYFRNSRVDIQDLDAETVHDMIIYIYSGKVAELEGKATGLLSAAEKYDLRVSKNPVFICQCMLDFDNIKHFIMSHPQKLL